MGLFDICLGKKCKCKKRCDAFFPSNIAIREGCKAACSADKNITPQQYLNKLCMYDPEGLLLAYGYDMCPNDDIDLDSLKDDRNDGSELERRRNLMFIAAILFLIFIYFIFKK